MTTPPTDAQRRIKAAVTELLSEKSLQSLTVSDIARRAGVNRGTFYLHYADRDQLMEGLATDTIQGIADLLADLHGDDTPDPSELIPERMIVSILHYLRSDIDFIAAMLGPNGDPSLADRVKPLVAHEIRRHRDATGERPDPTLGGMPQEYVDELLLSSIMAVVLLWIRRGAVEDPAAVAHFIAAARHFSPVDLLGAAGASAETEGA